MSIAFNQVMKKSDWIKILILLVVALFAWYFVFQEYSKPFELTTDIERQKLYQEYEFQKAEKSEAENTF